jgi:hypothetical protein
MKAILILISTLGTLSLVGCSAELGYSTGQAWQRSQCNQIRDTAEFNRCMKRADTTYESYKRQRESEGK